MSSHREAPEISKDPVADNADVYAFVSPDDPDTVTLISNFVPLQDPPGGPELLRVRRRRPVLDLHRQRRRRRAGDLLRVQVQDQLRNPKTFLYNTGPITSLDSPNWNKRQFYSVTRVEGTTRPRTATATRHRAQAREAQAHVLGTGLACPPCNIGPRSTPNYAARSAKPAVHTPAGRRRRCSPDSAGRLLRRPRVDLRPRRPAAVPEPAPDPERGRAGRRRDEDAQHPHDRACRSRSRS